jgi:hypothetical protein
VHASVEYVRSDGPTHGLKRRNKIYLSDGLYA